MVNKTQLAGRKSATFLSIFLSVTCSGMYIHTYVHTCIVRNKSPIPPLPRANVLGNNGLYIISFWLCELIRVWGVQLKEEVGFGFNLTNFLACTYYACIIESNLQRYACSYMRQSHTVSSAVNAQHAICILHASYYTRCRCLCRWPGPVLQP